MTMIPEPCTAPAAVDFEDAVFLHEGSNDVLLVPLRPAGHQSARHMQEHASSPRWKHWHCQSVRYTPDLSYFNAVDLTVDFNHTRRTVRQLEASGVVTRATAGWISCWRRAALPRSVTSVINWN